MAHEIVWTAGAEADLLDLYQQIDDHDLAIRVLREPLSQILRLLSEFPQMGAGVRGTQRMRRVLTGPRLRYGLFYVEEGKRIMIHALLDLRQDPQTVSRRLRGM
ncbi:MAG: type II toxin-antitoxin system RelE/ParE family toxin [Verrucomicrobiaceae bacterium]|nr:type II toxin-antitoxin system RelE/ParE family toxin [Verrucomicrobiaceae bacterium]